VDHLGLVNFMLALHFGFRSVPPCLQDHGLRLAYVGVAFRTGTGNVIEPDLVFHADGRRATLLVECKSGKNIDPKQLARYSGVTPEDIRDRLLLDVSHPRDHRVVPLIVCPHESASTIVSAANDMGHDVTVLGVGTRLELLGAAPPAILADAIAEVPEIGEDANPMYFFVPFDRETAKGDTARTVLPLAIGMLQAAAAGEGDGVDADRILQQSHRLIFDSMLPLNQRGELSDLRRVVKEVLREIVREEWKRWVVFSKNAFALKNPLEQGSDRIFQYLLRGADAYVARVEGREPPPEDDAQLLLDIYEPGDESDDT
jgi:hypothetical protein